MVWQMNQLTRGIHLLPAQPVWGLNQFSVSVRRREVDLNGEMELSQLLRTVCLWNDEMRKLGGILFWCQFFQFWMALTSYEYFAT